MNVVESLSEMHTIAVHLRTEGKSIGFVPTMGFLHPGHVSLVEKARKENDIVIVSIFVNPPQFGPQEDFEAYPRDMERDRTLLESFTDYLFCPGTFHMYRPDEKIGFHIDDLNKVLCGFFRPGHFEGVLRVLAKFFHLVVPHRVYLGQKDFQQTVVVRRMVEDLFFDLTMIVCPTMRESDGLAMSSRNVYLSLEQRKKAPCLYGALRLGLYFLLKEEKNSQVIIRHMRDFLERKGIDRIDYLDLRRARDLGEVKRVESDPVVLAGAIWLGSTRLIDNLLFDPYEA